MESDVVVAQTFDYKQHSQTPASLVKGIFHSQWFRHTRKLLTIKGKKIKQSRYTPGVAQRVPRS
jgi:hypothetical protein